MPIAYAGMLSMKKFAKCSAAMTMSASGRASRQRLAEAAQLGVQRVLQRGSASYGRGR